jgi:hypothetical protein
MGIRRVVTGHDSDGKAVFASDEVVDPINLDLLPATDFYRLWGSDEPARFPDDGSKPSGHNYFPGLGGFRFGLFSVAPDSVTLVDDIDFDAALAELENKLPGLGGHLEPEHPRDAHDRNDRLRVRDIGSMRSRTGRWRNL